MAKSNPARDFLAELVSNPLALDMLEALRGDPEHRENAGFYQRLNERKLPVEWGEGERRKLRDRLKNSGLAEALPAGLDLLPDIFKASPWMASCAPFLKPRNNSQLIRHVCAFLDWYLNPEVEIKTSRALVAALLSPGSTYVMLVSTLIIIALFCLTRQYSWHFLFSQPYIYQMLLARSLKHLAYGNDYEMRNEELFLYLLDSYRNEPTEGIAVMQAAQAASIRAAQASALKTACLESGAASDGAAALPRAMSAAPGEALSSADLAAACASKADSGRISAT